MRFKSYFAGIIMTLGLIGCEGKPNPLQEVVSERGEHVLSYSNHGVSNDVRMKLVKGPDGHDWIVTVGSSNGFLNSVHCAHCPGCKACAGK